MERDEFFEQTKNMLSGIDEMLVSYSMGDQLSAMDATILWMKLSQLTRTFADIKNKAQANDPAFQD